MTQLWTLTNDAFGQLDSQYYSAGFTVYVEAANLTKASTVKRLAFYYTLLQ